MQDDWGSGPSEIDPGCVHDTGLSPADVKDIQVGWAANMAAVQKYTIQQGAFNWQLFYNSGTLQGPPFAQGNAASCTKWFRETACVENSTLQHVPLLYGIERNHDYPPFKYIVSFEQSLAAFLLARGPFAWFGYSWISCIGDFGRGGPHLPPLNYTFPPALKTDYGVPQGVCAETAPGSGKFTRQWSKATVELDCSSWTSAITLKTDDDAYQTDGRMERHTMGSTSATVVCTDDLNCTLNGVCDLQEGACVCDTPWKGPTCGELDVLPAPRVGAYGMAPNVTSWGGNAVFFEGEYHLYVSEIVNGCGLSAWGANSQIVHATAITPLGPFQKHDVALPPWAHNPEVVLQTFSDGTPPNFVLFHIGDGVPNGGGLVNCSPSVPVSRSQQHVGDWPNVTVHFSAYPVGPWQKVMLNFTCINPAPLWHNESWYLLCGSGWWDILKAPKLEGPWEKWGRVPQGCGPKQCGGTGMGVWEDPYLYVDGRGHWHVIVHAYNSTTPCGACESPLVSAQMFSRNGQEWFTTNVSPYTNEVVFEDGSTHIFSTRERPKLLFNGRGQPTHLYNGVSPVRACAPKPGCSCKAQKGIDWDYTMAQPLRIGSIPLLH